MTYQPKPIPTTHVLLTPEVEALVERLAENAHDVWAERRIQSGWSVGPRSDEEKTNPSLRPYHELSEDEKEYDRDMVRNTINALLALGYRLERNEPAPGA